MFSVGADIKGKTIKELLNQDIKFFDIENCRTMVSQVIISKFSALVGMQDEIQSVLDEFTMKKELDLCLMAFTSILDNGSIFFISGEKAGWALKPSPTRMRRCIPSSGRRFQKVTDRPDATSNDQKYS